MSQDKLSKENSPSFQHCCLASASCWSCRTSPCLAASQRLIQPATSFKRHKRTTRKQALCLQEELSLGSFLSSYLFTFFGTGIPSEWRSPEEPRSLAGTTTGKRFLQQPRPRRRDDVFPHSVSQRPVR